MNWPPRGAQSLSIPPRARKYSKMYSRRASRLPDGALTANFAGGTPNAGWPSSQNVRWVVVAKPRTSRRFDEEELRRLEDEWFLQRHRGDVGISSTLLDDTYVGGTSAGVRVSKAEFLEGVRTLARRDARVSQSDRLIRRFGDTIVSTGLAELAFPGHTHRFRYLRVYQLGNDGPRLIASQSATVR